MDLSFEHTVSMFINDCLEYLRTGGPVVVAGMVKGEFAPTDDHDALISGLTALKRECMQAGGVDVDRTDAVIRFMSENPDQVRMVDPQDGSNN
jgi:threonine dehydrogenase-like Zn-dependent dehydrogenase